jgi:hypothetical protein
MTDMESIEQEDGMHRKITRESSMDRANRSDVRPSRTPAAKARRRVRLARRANR